MLKARFLTATWGRFTVAVLAIAAGALITVALIAGPRTSEARTTLPAEAKAKAEAPPPAPARAAAVAPNLSEAALSGRPVNIGVFGDSFGDGIWWALDQQLRDDEGIVLHRLARPATGFTSYGRVNLLDDVRSKLDRQPLDIAILSFGANDTQGIAVEGRALAYMSDDWRRVIGGRIEAVVGLLRERGIQVYWIGLPKMRSPTYDEKAQRMNAFYAERMRALNVPFIDTVASTSDAQGRYADRLPNPRTGEPVAARNSDGIHMTMNGYTILTRGLARHLRRSVATARGEAARTTGGQAANRTRGTGTDG